jgi:predicted RNase H-like HicB family nuclease
MKLKVIIETGESGFLIGSVPALPGCRSQGATRDELLANLKEAAEGWIEVQQDKFERGDLQGQVDLITI